MIIKFFREKKPKFLLDIDALFGNGLQATAKHPVSPRRRPW
jgi:hypothetical protein